jgi:hypothetical protein
MDRYADRLDTAAGMADPVRIRPAEPGESSDDEATAS